jgi:nicotinamidase-related amidase
MPKEISVPVTTLDEKTALIVVDLQKGIVASPTVHPVDDLVQRASALAEAFRSHGLPVVLVTVTGQPAGRTDQGSRAGSELPADFAELIPELNRQPDDHIVVKRARSAFTNTGLTEHLQHMGVTQVVIVGISTSGGVESTARHAHEYGFNVTVAIDAMTDLNADAHEHTITRIFPRVAETGLTDEILSLLEGNS